MDNDVGHWIYVYYKPLQAIDLISTVIDNSDKHKMTLLIQVDKGDIHTVTYENCNDIIKALLYLYIKKPVHMSWKKCSGYNMIHELTVILLEILC